MENSRYIIIVGILVVLAMLVYLLQSAYESWYQADQSQMVVEQFVPVTGTVYDPVTNQPVAGVTLGVGDTVIETGESGQFRFSQVSTVEGIVLTDNSLETPVSVLSGLSSSSGMQLPQQILYDPSLFSVLELVLQATSASAVYQYIPAAVSELISTSTFMAWYDDQHEAVADARTDIRIADFSRLNTFTTNVSGQQFIFTMVIAVTIEMGGMLKTYHFTLSDSKTTEREWYYIPV